jgi:hypothetical protein
VHLRGYHLKANRLFEPTSQTAAAFMAADSHLILMDPRFRNVLDPDQCGRHCRVYRHCGCNAPVYRASPAQARPRAASRQTDRGSPPASEGPRVWHRPPIPQLFDFILGDAGGRSRVVVHHSTRGRSICALGQNDRPHFWAYVSSHQLRTCCRTRLSAQARRPMSGTGRVRWSRRQQVAIDRKKFAANTVFLRNIDKRG